MATVEPWARWSRVDRRADRAAGRLAGARRAGSRLRCTGRIGECRYRTAWATSRSSRPAGGAHVRCRRRHGRGGRRRAEITTAGAVRIGRIDGSAVIKNRNGDTWIGEVTGDARVKASNGAISIDLARASVVAKTANGDVRLGEVAGGAVVARARSGRSSRRPGRRRRWLDLETKFGTVRNDLDATGRPAGGGRGRGPPTPAWATSRSTAPCEHPTGGAMSATGPALKAVGAQDVRRNGGARRIDLDVETARSSPARSERRRQDHDRADSVHPDPGRRRRVLARPRRRREPDAVRHVIGVTGQSVAVDNLLTGEENLTSWRI